MSDEKWVLGLGEVLWDCFPDRELPGGAPANFAFHAAQLGCRAAVLSRVGDDRRGEDLLALLQNGGVVTDYIQRDAAHATGTVEVDTSRPDQPRFTIRPDAAWDFMEWTPQWREAAENAAAVCFGTLAQRSPTSRETIRRVLSSVKDRALVVYDVNLRQDYFDRSRIEESLRLCHVVKLNEEEEAALTELLELGPCYPREFAARLQDRYGVRAVCITRGANGCLVIEGDQVADEPGVAVEVVDTVGAGDAFTAAWVFARLRGQPLHRQAQFANRVGALVASRPGAMPIVKDELRALMEELSL
ncbi:MAG: carbohydrate kinase [Thermogutta sp.]|nr:carbohydrate kinase [Thermogutta sp.]